MISLHLARRLRDSGLRWNPADGDRFIVPDRGMDDQVFTISGMTVDVREVPGGRIIAFNGTVEWALDSINQWEVVWLPRESQMREALGDAFVALTRAEDGFSCTITLEGEQLVEHHPSAEEAYGLALLHCVRARTRADLAAVHASSARRRSRKLAT